ncbi:MAG: hypothetical protein DLM73_06440 [Chthoniobacterales bacterium]|nr:MAG: hypothetical protein DLM73_06440 [Chthoniobacterales bacterium]
MRFNPFTIFLSLALAWSSLNAQAPAAKPAFGFGDIGYFHRWSKNDQHEFTPEKQEDLDKWSDMITINAYPDVHDGERLAEVANAVLGNYTKHQAKIIKTNSVPRTADRPAEHLIVAIFTQPSFIEVAFARLKLVDSAGCSIVYSHRIYGAKAADRINTWLKGDGANVEKALMEWKLMPFPVPLSSKL